MTVVKCKQVMGVTMVVQGSGHMLAIGVVLLEPQKDRLLELLCRGRGAPQKLGQ